MSTNFPYNPDLPNPPDDPSQDVGGMQKNAQTIGNWVAVDHVGFGNVLGGQHSKVTFPSTITPPSQGGLGSVISTVPGVASSSIAQAIYTVGTTPNVAFPMSAIRAFGICAGNLSGATPLLNGYNVTSITRDAGSSIIKVTMPANVVTSMNYAVICSSGMALSQPLDQVFITFSAMSLTTFEMKTVVGGMPMPVSNVSFVVLQF